MHVLEERPSRKPNPVCINIKMITRSIMVITEIWMCGNEPRMIESGLNHVLGRVKRSNLVQTERDTSPDVLRGLTRVQERSLMIISCWERPENSHLGCDNRAQNDRIGSKSRSRKS